MNTIQFNQAELLLEIGALQVFHYPTQFELEAQVRPTKVFWQDTKSHHTYGPFKGIYEAVAHYTWIISTQKSEPKVGQVVYVDFSNKRRIVYGGQDV